MTLFWAALPGVLSGLIVGVFMAYWNHQQRKRDELAELERAQRKRSEQVRISLLVASAKLSYAVAMAVKRGSPNGEIEQGVAQYQEAMKEFREFERELLAEKSADS